MNNANVKLLPYIQKFDDVAQVLELLYVFADVDILPEIDPLGLSPHLLEMFRHLWLDAIRMGIKLEISQGGFSDASGLEIHLEEKYLLDNILPTGMAPDHFTTLASVIDVDSFLKELRKMFVYSKFYAVYRAKSKTMAVIPPNYTKVPGVGISPYSDGGWYVPELMHTDFDSGTLFLGFETHTPNVSGYEEWYDDGGRMFIIFHPCLANTVLRSNLPHIGFGAAGEPVWTRKLLNTNDGYPACVPPYTIYSASMNEHFIQEYCQTMGYAPKLIHSNHERGSWSSYDWSSAISPYYWSHENHGLGCPLACQLCYKNAAGFGEDALLIKREWVLGCYGRPGTSPRDLYPYATSVPKKDYFSAYPEYLFLDGLNIDIESKATVVAEWDATGQNSVSLSHYGGVVGSTRYNDMIILDRADYFLSSVGIVGGEFSASPINYIRNYRHGDDGRRDGTLYLLGRKIPDDYIIYYRPFPIPKLGGMPLPPIFPLSKTEIGIDLIKDEHLQTALQYHTEPVGYEEEELNYL